MNDLEIYYSQEHIEKILNVLSKNDIKIEFEDPLSLIKSLQEIGQISLKKETEIAFFKSKRLILLEFDVAKKEIISSGIAYPCSTMNYCPYPEVREQLQIILELFSFHPRHVVDLFGVYGVMYAGQDTNKVEGFYYWVDRGILYDLVEHSWNDILEVFDMPPETIGFLKKETDNMHLDYIGFDMKNIIRKMAFATTKEWFLYREPEKFYSDYKNINSIVELINNYFPSSEHWTSLQYCPQNPKYFAVELSLDPNYIHNFAKTMYEYGIIDEIEYNNYNEMTIPAEYQMSIVKFRWDDENNFCVKLYLEEFLDNMPRKISVDSQ